MAQKIFELPLTPIQESTQWLYAPPQKKKYSICNRKWIVFYQILKYGLRC